VGAGCIALILSMVFWSMTGFLGTIFGTFGILGRSSVAILSCIASLAVMILP
jgi:hypothetical protein